MIQRKVMVMGTSPAETLRLEAFLQQCGCLQSFRYIGLEQAREHVPDWRDYTQLIVRYTEAEADLLLALLAAPLRDGPPVLFLLDPYCPRLAGRLLQAGAWRVVPLQEADAVLAEEAVLRDARPPVTESGVEINHDAGTGAPFSQALITGEIGFARLFQTGPVGVCLAWERDGLCVDCNERYAGLLEWPRAELVGKPALELGDLEQIAAKLKSHDGELVVEQQVFTRTGRRLFLQVYFERVQWQGQACILAMAQDITEKEQTRTELNRLNETLDRMVRIRTGALEAANRELAAEIGRREVLEDFSKQLSQIIWETPDVVAICAPDGRLEFLNKAGRALFGLKEDQAITHLDLYSAYSEEGRERVRSTVMPLVLREGIWRGESEFRRPDGSQIPISQVLLCQKDAAGDVLFFACIARDISNQKHVEQELRQSRERYRTLAEAAHDFIFMVSPDGVMEYANNFSCQLLGFSPEAVAGTPVDGFFPPDFAANHLHLIRDVQDVDRPVYTEGPFQLDGQVFWLGTWLVPIHSDQGALVSILGISRDITEQKKTDEALQRALQNERRLSEMRSSFFSMTSHQFRTPLNTILLSTQMLQKYGARLDETKRTEQLSRIQEAALRLNAMLEDILLIGRAESGRYVVAPKLFDLVSYCRETINEIAANDQDAHPFHFSPEAEPMPVFLDTEVLHRLLDNLFSNAVKYSPAGAPVTVRVRKDSELVVLEVTDQGIGIPERDMKFLFQPFQRGSNAVDFPGSGIGLTIIQKSVELLGGSISVKSVEGQGSTFLVRFPARMERPSQPDMA